jgi:hypothetical protein
MAKMCSGKQIARLNAASTSNAPRQPHHSMRPWVSGIKTVLAKPATRVISVILVRKLSGKSRVTTAKTGS